MAEGSGEARDTATKVDSVADAGATRTTRFARIIDRYQGPLLRYVGRVIGSESDQTEDVVQECFLRLHRAWGRADEPPMERIGAWLFTVAHNLTMDVIRKRKHQRDLRNELNAEAAEAGGDEQSVTGQATQSEAAAAALAAMDRLPREQKQVVLMKVLEGLTFRQIAKATGSSLGSVNYRLNKALSTLARQLKQTGHL
jgi:RNA polymerase sigma-70 factor, ECF subfamily